MSSRLRHLGVLFLLALAACAHRPEMPQQTQPQRSAGYISAEQYPVRELRETLNLGEETLSLLFVQPEAPGRFPLVIFLGGLGNGPDSASALLREWAAAGYIVLSVQDARHGPAVLGSVKAREGDYRLLAREAYGEDSLQRRLNTLNALLQVLQQRPPQGDTLPDLQKLMLVGFDLGAQTVQAALGEHYAGVNTPALALAPRAALILSPHAGFGGESFSERYRDMRLPALMVSSSEDADRFDYSLNPRLREMPFRHMPGGEKYWLTLNYASHSVIGGGAASALPSSEAPQASSRSERSGGPGGGSGGGGGPGGGGGGPGGGGGGPGGGRGGPGNDMRGGAGGPGSQSAGQSGPASQDDQILSLRSVSLAWLDMMLHDDAFAREWLQRDANRWLAGGGRLLKR